MLSTCRAGFFRVGGFHCKNRPSMLPVSKFLHMRLCSPQHCESLETILSPQCKGNNSRGVLKTVFHALWQAPYLLSGFTITALCGGDWIIFLLQLIEAKHKRRNKPTITLLLRGSVRIKMSGQPPSHGS